MGERSIIVADVSGNHAEGVARAYGGAIYNAGTITGGEEGELVVGNLIGNYVIGATEANGGAIYDTVSTKVAIDGDASGNYVKVTDNSDVAGGVIYLKKTEEGEGTTITVSGNVTESHAGTAGGSAYGGAFYTGKYDEENYDTVTISGEIISGNYVSAMENALGGAICNEGFLNIEEGVDLIGNYTVSTEGAAVGGAIFDTISTEVHITGDASDNYVKTWEGDVYGGVIYLTQAAEASTVITVRGDVSGNHTETENGSAYGGVFYTDEDDIVVIDCDISWNLIKASGDSMGGAVYNAGSLTIEDGVNLSGNYAKGAEAATGGAIAAMDSSSITISWRVTGNYAESSDGDAAGGAISLADGSLTIEGDVTGNYAEGAGTVMGGAIVNMGELIVTGSITDNRAEGEEAAGGAIYNAGIMNIIADSGLLSISDNTAVSGGAAEDNAIYSDRWSEINITLSGIGEVLMNDSIDGEDYTVTVTSEDAGSNTLYIYNDMNNADLIMGSITLNTINNEVHTYAIKSFSLSGDVNMVADVDLANETMDRITAKSYGEHAGTINISGMNLISDTSKSSVEIAFAEDGLKDYVTSLVGTLSDSNNQQKAYTPLYQYDLSYDDRDDAGYFAFDKVENNPAALTSQASQMGLYNAASMMYNYAFEHSEYYIRLPKGERLNAEGEEGGIYRNNELTEQGVWARLFSSFETVPFKGNMTLKAKYYGVLVGVDSAVKDYGKWAGVLTGYVGYDGIYQKFEGNSISQNGGIAGVTGTLYNRNFYVAATVAGGWTTAKIRTMYGYENTHLYNYGIAAKAGYNLEFRNGKYSFLPTFMASYTNVGADDYTNAAGLRIDTKAMHAFQLNPNVKLVRNLGSGWQPYITIGEIWTVGQSMGGTADGTSIS